MKKAKILLTLLMSLLLCAGMAACNPADPVEPGAATPPATSGGAAPASGSSEPQQPAAPVKDTLTVAYLQDVTSMDPHSVGGVGGMTSQNVRINIFDALLQRDENNELAPMLATKWEAIDEVTWQFTLREDVTFHNGEPFNADTVVYSIARMQGMNNIFEFQNVVAVEKVSEYVVNFITDGPDPILPNKVIMFPGLIVPKDYVEEVGDDYFGKNPIGCGPYKMVSWTQDSEIVLEAYEGYWGEQPGFENLVIKIIPNATDMLAALRVGEIDIATAGITADMSAIAEADENLKVITAPNCRKYLINLNCLEGPTTDVRVRQAMNHAIDIPTIIDALYGGNGNQLASLYAPQAFGWNPDVQPYNYDPEKAKELLAEAGYPDGFKQTVVTSSADTIVIQAICSYLNEVGIETDIEIVDAATLSAIINPTNANATQAIYYIGSTAWTLDGFNEIMAYGRPGINNNRFVNDRVTELADLQEKSLDQQLRAECLSEIQQIYHDEAYFIPMWQLDTIMAMSIDVDYTPNPIGLLYWAQARPAAQ